jgi:hypothetical protein
LIFFFCVLFHRKKARPTRAKNPGTPTPTPTPIGTLLELLFVSLAAAIFVGEDVGEDKLGEAVGVLEELEDVVEVLACVELVLAVEWVIDRGSVVMTFAPAGMLNTCDEFVQSQPPNP